MEQDKTSFKQVNGKGGEVIRNERGQIVSGTANPFGRPAGVKNFTTKVKEALEKIADGETDTTNEQKLIKKILKKAIEDGNTAMINIIWEQLDGKPTQRNENTVNITGLYDFLSTIGQSENSTK